MTAARHAYERVPLRVSADDLGIERPDDVVALKDLATGCRVPVQLMMESGRRCLCWILDDLPVGQSRTYELLAGMPVSDSGVELVERDGERIEFRVGGGLFMNYYYGRDIPRPFLYPVVGPGGRSVTRDYPMAEGIPGETTDHPHHRSIWVAFGDVNGVDDWSEAQGHGRIVHRQFLEKSSGPVFGRVRALNDWVDTQGKRIMEEERAVAVYNLPDTGRFIDVNIVFRASDGDVRFGDTKEGGIVSVRVATSMDGNKGGVISNSFGGVAEAEAWGKRAHWCDYSGPVDDRVVGITIFDHPNNFRHPTYWHVRDYGLITANPFALSAYKNDPAWDGSYVVKSGESFAFAYRVYVHDGDVKGSSVAEQYHGYVNPPAVQPK